MVFGSALQTCGIRRPLCVGASPMKVATIPVIALVGLAATANPAHAQQLSVLLQQHQRPRSAAPVRELACQSSGNPAQRRDGPMRSEHPRASGTCSRRHRAARSVAASDGGGWRQNPPPERFAPVKRPCRGTRGGSWGYRLPGGCPGTAVVRQARACQHVTLPSFRP